MNHWPNYTHFAGLDWASHHHDLIVVDAHGAIVDHLRFDHTAQGWSQCRERLAAYGSLPVAMLNEQQMREQIEGADNA